MRLRSLIKVNPTKSALAHLSPATEVTFAPMEAIAGGLGGLDTSTTKTLEEVGSGSYSFFANGDVLLAKVTPCFEVHSRPHPERQSRAGVGSPGPAQSAPVPRHPPGRLLSDHGSAGRRWPGGRVDCQVILTGQSTRHPDPPACGSIMTLVVDKRMELAGRPGLHAFIVGVSAYPNLPADPEEPAIDKMRQLSCSALSAHRVSRWLLTRRHPIAPLATCRLLLLPSPVEIDAEKALENLGGRPTLAEFELAAAAWRNDASTDPKNMTFFYFAGHGLQQSLNSPPLLLLEEFGGNPHRKLGATVNSDNLIGGMAPLGPFHDIARTSSISSMRAGTLRRRCSRSSRPAMVRSGTPRRAARTTGSPRSSTPQPPAGERTASPGVKRCSARRSWNASRAGPAR